MSEMRDATMTNEARWLWPTVLAAMGLLFVILRLVGLGANSYWLDELLSLQFATMPVGSMVDAIRHDIVHPPLYFILLHGWLAIAPHTEAGARLLSVLCSIGGAAFVVVAIRTAGGSKTAATLGLFLATTSEYLIYYAQDVRMYSLMFCLSAAALALVLKADQRGAWTRQAGVTAFAVFTLMVYCHYFGLLLLGAFAVWVLLCRRALARGFLLIAGSVAVAFLPWVVAIRPAFVRRGGLGYNLG